MDCKVKKHSLIISGHYTSISLEDAFWQELKNIAKKKNITLSALVAEVDNRREGNLSGALRLLVLNELKASASLIL